MKLNKKGMQCLRLLHILSMSIWFGAVVSIGVLAYICFFALSEADFLTIAPLVPELYRKVVMPAAIFTIVQGITYGLFTNWGFFKYKWVLFKWILALLVTLCTGLGGIGNMFSALDKVKNSGFTGGLADGGFVLLFIALQILFMIIMIILSVFQPKNRKRVQEFSYSGSISTMN
ncbi:MAG: hypothetical protein ACOX6E_00065 [Syntrophomonadaceae bacterium]